MRTIVIVGATSSIAQHCAREWLREQPSRIVLCGREPGRVERAAADLRVRSPGSQVDGRIVRFDPPGAIQEDVDSLCAPAVPDIVLVAHGLLPDQRECQVDLAAAGRALQVNGLSAVLFAEAFARHMETAGRGTLVVIGSVAGDRGRRKNYVYGAAKAMVDRYLEGLQHRFASSAVKIVRVKPGPTGTPMTAGMDPRRLAPVERVARDIVRGVRDGRAVIYTPARWRPVMLVLRHLPRWMFGKLDI